MTDQPIRIEDLNVGDKLELVGGEIIETDNSIVPIHIRRPNGSSRWITLAEIATHTPKPKTLKVGDRVKCKSSPGGKVLALHGNQAWIAEDSNTAFTYDLSDLTPA